MSTIPNIKVGLDSNSRTLTVDNYMLETYRFCQEKYRLAVHEAWRPNDTAAALAFGIASHEARAAYKKEILQHGKVDIDWAVNVGLASWDGEMPVEMKTEVMQDDKRGRKNFERLMRGYFEKYGDPVEFEPLQVEVPGMRVLGTTPKGWIVQYVYTIDEIVKHRGRVYPLEYKTSGTAYPPDAQFFAKFHNLAAVTGYIWACEEHFGYDISGAIIHATWVHSEPKASSRSKYTLPDYFKMDYTYRDDDQIQEWKQNTLLTCDNLADSIQNGRWQRADGPACAMYSGCDMRKVCGGTPGIRNVLLDMDFYKKPWNPWARID